MNDRHTCIIIEDQIPAQRILKTYIEDAGVLSLKGTFIDAIQALEFLKTEVVDIVFLDIHLPKISGIDFLQILPKEQNVIVTTAYPDYALKGYEFNILDYLLKPFSFQRFIKAVSRIELKSTDNRTIEPAKAHFESTNNFFFLKSGHEHLKITYDDIIYIKSDNDYTSIITSQKKHLVPITLSQWNTRLAADKFYQVHKSYIINVGAILKVSGNQITLENGIKIPIGRTYKDAFMKDCIKKPEDIKQSIK